MNINLETSINVSGGSDITDNQLLILECGNLELNFNVDNFNALARV